jgi:uncharacterized protein YeaO (DUF488 family)
LTVRVVRLGTPRRKGEGPRLGAVRRPPRGVRKSDYARLDYYDVWLPELSPTQKWVSWAQSRPWSDARWRRFERNYRREMARPEAQHLIELLAVLSRTARFSIGCYCEDERRCHRSLLKDLLRARRARLAA